MVKNKESYKGLFISDTDWINDARLNHRVIDRFELLVEGYQRAAEVLVNHVIENGRDQDYLVYPIVFLYRHHLELRLKEIIREGKSLLDEGQDFPITHDLHILWHQVKEVIKKLWPDEEETEEECLIERIVNEFKTIDPQSMSFRYPEDKRGDNPLASLDYINLRHLYEMIQQASNFLYGVSAAIAEYKSAASDYSYDVYM